MKKGGAGSCCRGNLNENHLGVEGLHKEVTYNRQRGPFLFHRHWNSGAGGGGWRTRLRPKKKVT